MLWIINSDFTINRKSYKSLRFFLRWKLRSNQMVRLNIPADLLASMLGSCACEQKVLLWKNSTITRMHAVQRLSWSGCMWTGTTEKTECRIAGQFTGKFTVWKGSTTRVTAAPSKTGFPGLQGVTLAWYRAGGTSICRKFSVQSLSSRATIIGRDLAVGPVFHKKLQLSFFQPFLPKEL